MKPEDVIADRKRPYTGAEYMQSLRDGREVYIDGERVHGRHQPSGVSQLGALASRGSTTRCTTRSATMC